MFNYLTLAIKEYVVLTKKYDFVIDYSGIIMKTSSPMGYLDTGVKNVSSTWLQNEKQCLILDHRLPKTWIFKVSLRLTHLIQPT